MKKKKIVLLGLGVLTGLIGMQAWTATDVAKVNGRAITSHDIQVALSGFNEFQKDSIMKDGLAKQQVLENLIDQELLVQEAEKNKIDQTQEYKDAMAAARKQTLTNIILQKRFAGKMTEEAAKKYYEAHRAHYTTDSVRAQHILVFSEKEALDIRKLATAPNADFQALAEKYSKDPSAKNNRGELGFFTRDRMVMEFTDPVFQANAGDIVGPVKTDYGFHIVKVLEKKPGKLMEYHEIELRVKADLRRELTAGIVGSLRKTAKIEIPAAAKQ